MAYFQVCYNRDTIPVPVHSSQHTQTMSSGNRTGYGSMQVDRLIQPSWSSALIHGTCTALSEQWQCNLATLLTHVLPGETAAHTCYTKWQVLMHFLYSKSDRRTADAAQ